jgi:hypothetical protein
MDRRITRAHALIGAVAVLCLLAVPIAAASGSEDPQATASGVKKQVKKLKRKVRNLQQQVDELARAPGARGFYVRTHPVPQCVPGPPATVGVPCGTSDTAQSDDSDSVVGGGYDLGPSGGEGSGGIARVVESIPRLSPGDNAWGWHVSFAENYPNTTGKTVYAVCAQAADN